MKRVRAFLEKGPFITDCCAACFDSLRNKCIITERLKRSKWIQDNFDAFIELWCIVLLLLSLIAVLTLPLMHRAGWWGYVLVPVAACRVTGTFIILCNTAFFDEYRARKRGEKRSLVAYRSVVLLLLNCAEITLWYAAIYLVFSGSFENLRTSQALQAIEFSFNTITTFGYTTVKPIDLLGCFIVLTEAVIGIFLVVVALTYFMSLLSEPLGDSND